MWCHYRLLLTILLLLLSSLVMAVKQNRNRDGNRYNLKFLKNHRGIGNNVRRNANSSNVGLWPSVFNLATKAVISANATCGVHGREEFCRLTETAKGRCGICDDYSTDPNKRHPINFAIDGTNKWWQSPSLFYGPDFEYVTVTVDLKQEYQVAYIILKAANSPRPGTWVLEKSKDGQHFSTWQYFARTDKECLDQFKVPATKGKPHYFTDSEIICTSYFSKLTPLENGEVHISLIQGRPGANETSPELLEFTKARYVRFRLMGLRGNLEQIPKSLSQDRMKDKKLFYSIKDISIGGQCVCNGHAENCRHNVASGHPECECLHHTCGANCETCCPLYNQRRWFPGSSRDAQICLPCNCHGHAKSCRYDEEVDRSGLSLSADGSYQGGGVCENCTDFTTGVNCEKCLTGFFRPMNVSAHDSRPCLKCECSVVGASLEICVQYGESAGACKCKLGYTGLKCDICAPGFRGYPNCESCPCDPKGVTATADCEGECLCKANVEGKYCDRCKSGYFGLSETNADGCLSCFCSGVTTLCELGFIQLNTIQTLQNWLITDLRVSAYITPVTSLTSVFSVGNYELPGIENLYWLAPRDYLGNKLEIYGSSFVFNVQWVVMRGDTSGEPTIGPDMIVVGSNGLQLGYGDHIYGSQKMSFNIPLSEHGWYIIPNEIPDITTRMAKSDYIKGPATRQQFLHVLTDIKHILLRGTFHTDQIEALLESATMSYGNEELTYESGSVEKCSCPSGYSGLSCESCSFGYVRIFANSSKNEEESFCGKCDCNGHSATCNADTGECFCQHNTVGEKCERCAVGFYGNPLRSTIGDCKKCACPLENFENNFSPSCQLDYFNLNNEGGYVCTQCPKGYTGDHCEICDDGYFGDPLEIGNSCRPCDCNGGPCDRKTGQCLACKGNTEGWKCERCKSDHYGDPAASNCKACECDPLGSESKQCHNVSGQCTCKSRFIGRTCDQCELGFGNVTALCPPCSCNSIGSKSGICDDHTGICDCLPGVDGFHCDACQNLHWGFSTSGCQACNCDINGSKYSSCDPTTGNCICKPYYEGRTCDICKAGYWKTLKEDCIKCHCDENGSLDPVCHRETGQCNCKPGVAGQNCDQCLPNYYGTVDTECIECEPCTKKGHVCGKGGKCVCPLLTIGRECERCTLNSWGHDPRAGCKACNCSISGSSGLQCDKHFGTCPCKVGYEGNKCDRCTFGYYGFPNCRKCLCNSAGTLDTECRTEDCQCNEDGSCNCKESVTGFKCNTCKNGTFGLSKENPQGCINCFCFERSSQCVDTKYNWDKIRFEKRIESNEPISTDTISLPKKFMGDLTTSYDGYLSVSGGGGRFTVFLTGNGISLNSEVSTNELKLNENYWTVTSGNIAQSCQISLSRECMLLVLQKVTSIVIQGQDMEIVEVLLDSAKPYIPYNRTSHSIEKCDCSPEYKGLSCQDPNRGFYRHFLTEYEATRSSWIDKVVGVARPCDCNGRSSECDPDNGHCKNCSNNTAGFHCELCDTGYYQDYSGHCQPCLCPSELENNAESCVAKKYGFTCHCKIGYTGSKCENCKDSYFRDPFSNKCIPCNCNNYGSHSSICTANGICQCKSGFYGEKCNQCKNPRQYIKDGICTPCGECTQLLFNDIDRLYKALDNFTDRFKDGLSPPWKLLDSMKSKFKAFNKTFNYKHDRVNHILRTGNIRQLEDVVFNMVERVHALEKLSSENTNNITQNQETISKFTQELKNINDDINNLVKQLTLFGKKHIDAEAAVEQANSILVDMKHQAKPRITNVEIHNQLTLDYCERISDEVNGSYLLSSKLPNDELEELNKKLDYINTIATDVRSKTVDAQFQNENNKKSINRLRKSVDEINNLSTNIETNLSEFTTEMKNMIGKLGELRNIIAAMDNYDFSNLTELDRSIYKFEEDSPALEELVRKASEHASKLRTIVDARIAALNFTKDETEKIKTSGAYNEIVDSIATAKNTANEARLILQNVLDFMYPRDSDSLFDKANLAHTKSDRLKYRIENMKNISNNLNARRKDVDNFKESLIDSGKFNNDLSRQLQYLERLLLSEDYIVNKLQETIDNSSRIIDKMRQIEKTMSELNITVRYDLFIAKNTFLKARVEAEEDIQTASFNVKEAVKKVSELLNNSNNKIDNFANNGAQHKLERVTSKIEELRNKILYAKQAAESINIAMGLSNCSMTYSSPLYQGELFRSLAITFRCANCQLFKWERGGINIAIENGKAIMNFMVDDIGDEISTDKEGGSKFEKTLFVQRIGSLLQMKFENDTTWKAADIGNQALIIDPTDRFEIGDGINIQHNAYIYKLAINDNNLGLWKFSQTNGKCTGQQRVNAKEVEKARPFYSGRGYMKYNKTAVAAPAKFNLKFYFSTFDENSLIYLAQESQHPSAFISLTIEDGYLRFDIRHNNDKTVSLKLKEKCNDGKTYSASIVMTYENRYQIYKLGIDGSESNQALVQEPLLPSAVFRIRQAVHFVGGVSPTLNTTLINVNKKSFLGFLDTRNQFDNESISTGITQKAGELQLHKAWFNGNGSLHLRTELAPSRAFQRLSTISFILRPLNANAAILDIENFGTVTLSNRLLQINLNNGEHYLANKTMPLNINDYNIVSLIFKSDMISLTINEEDENIYRSNSDNLFEGDVIKVVVGSTDGFHSLYGGISDLTINNENIAFTSETVTGFSKVEMGREAPFFRQSVTLKGLSIPTNINVTNSMQSTQGCATSANYVTHPTAVSFGDQPDSYLKIKTQFWKKDFKLEFEFRTLDSNGLLFLSTGSSAANQYKFLELKDGLLTFHIKGKRKIPKNWPVTFPIKVADGAWHSLKFVKKGKKLQMWLDGKERKSVRFPKSAVRNEFFIGNVPGGYTLNTELKERIYPFRGCINNLKINEETILPGAKTNDVVYSNIRQCFPHIEEGAYFGGDAYAVFREDFRINKILDLSFDFRTAEQNGILLTVSNEGNYPALSVELQNGAVVMTIDLGNGIQSNVTNNLDSDFALCNNMWHNVTAMYSSSELTVNVDGIRKSWVQSEVNSVMDEIDAPLYIGGLPDNAAVGTLKIRENFKGCMKNLKIENNLKPWSAMEKLNSVLLNSCPVAASTRS